MIYRELVAKRKTCHLCRGLTNPADTLYCHFDSDEIGPWSLWQGSLTSRVVVVGQDWGDTSYFLKWEGKDQPRNPTNSNLRALLAEIGYRIGEPQQRQEQVLFFTNLILCLKEGGLQGPVRREWFSNCAGQFFKPLLAIINPAAVLTLGAHASRAILAAYQIPFRRSDNLQQLMQKSPYVLTPSTVLFPLYHCGSRTVNWDRSFVEQREDWRRIGRWLSRDRSGAPGDSG